MQCYLPENSTVRIIDTLQHIPKAFAFLKTTIDNYLQQEIGDIISIIKYPPKTPRFCPMMMQQKIQSTRLPKFCKEAYLSPAYKFYCYPQCYHRARMKIFNHQKSPAYQHQLQGWNRFRNLQGCKYKIHHPYHLQ